MVAKRDSRRKVRLQDSAPPEIGSRPLENTRLQSDPAEIIADRPAQNQSIRAELQTALEYLREGDVFVVQSIDRLSQNIEDLRRVLLALSGRGIVVEFMKELLATTADDGAPSKLFVDAISSVAKLHRAIIDGQRRVEVQSATKVPGRMGRKPSLTNDRVVELRRRAAAGEKKVALAREFGISRETLYQYLDVN